MSESESASASASAASLVLEDLTFEETAVFAFKRRARAFALRDATAPRLPAPSAFDTVHASNSFMVTSSHYGFAVIATEKGLKYISAARWQDDNASAKVTEISYPLEGVCLGLELNSDDLSLAVLMSDTVFFYQMPNVPDNTAPVTTFSMKSKVRALKWSRNNPTLFAVMPQSPSPPNIFLLDTATNGRLSFPRELRVVDFAWEPDGDRLAFLMESGQINLVSFTPDLKSFDVSETIDSPSWRAEDGDGAVTPLALRWLMPDLFVTAFRRGDDVQLVLTDDACAYLLNMDTSVRDAPFTLQGACVDSWALATLTTSQSESIMVVGKNEAAAAEDAESAPWVVWTFDDTSTPEVPAERHVLGLGFDLSNTLPVPRPNAGDPPYQPMPVFLFLTDDGNINPHYLIKSNQADAEKIDFMEPAQPLPPARERSKKVAPPASNPTNSSVPSSTPSPAPASAPASSPSTAPAPSANTSAVVPKQTSQPRADPVPPPSLRTALVVEQRNPLSSAAPTTSAGVKEPQKPKLTVRLTDLQAAAGASTQIPPQPQPQPQPQPIAVKEAPSLPPAERAVSQVFAEELVFMEGKMKALANLMELSRLELSFIKAEPADQAHPFTEPALGSLLSHTRRVHEATFAIKKNNDSQATSAEGLKSDLIESSLKTEEVRSLLKAYKDPAYQALQNQLQLDPEARGLQRRLRDTAATLEALLVESQGLSPLTHSVYYNGLAPSPPKPTAESLEKSLALHQTMLSDLQEKLTDIAARVASVTRHAAAHPELLGSALLLQPTKDKDAGNLRETSDAGALLVRPPPSETAQLRVRKLLTRPLATPLPTAPNTPATKASQPPREPSPAATPARPSARVVIPSSAKPARKHEEPRVPEVAVANVASERASALDAPSALSQSLKKGAEAASAALAVDAVPKKADVAKLTAPIKGADAVSPKIPSAFLTPAASAISADLFGAKEPSEKDKPAASKGKEREGKGPSASANALFGLKADSALAAAPEAAVVATEVPSGSPVKAKAAGSDKKPLFTFAPAADEGKPASVFGPIAPSAPAQVTSAVQAPTVAEKKIIDLKKAGGLRDSSNTIMMKKVDEAQASTSTTPAAQNAPLFSAPGNAAASNTFNFNPNVTKSAATGPSATALALFGPAASAAAGASVPAPTVNTAAAATGLFSQPAPSGNVFGGGGGGGIGTGLFSINTNAGSAGATNASPFNFNAAAPSGFGGPGLFGPSASANPTPNANASSPFGAFGAGPSASAGGGASPFGGLFSGGGGFGGDAGASGPIAAFGQQATLGVASPAAAVTASGGGVGFGFQNTGNGFAQFNTATQGQGGGGGAVFGGGGVFGNGQGSTPASPFTGAPMAKPSGLGSQFQPRK